MRVSALVASTAISTSLLCVAAAHADEAQSRVTGFEEIIVTAQKREEKLQSVPISVTALTETQLARLGANDFYSFARTVPGLSFNNTLPGRNNIALRGIVAAAGSPTVGMYIDEVVVTGGGGDDSFIGSADPRIFDISRIEVLRGPQGTLYGAGSMGGTIKFVTNKPKLDVTEGSIEGEVASTRSGNLSYKSTVVLNTPVVEDVVAIRAGVSFLHQGGYIDRIERNVLAEKNANETNDLGIRVTAMIKPNDKLEIIPAIYYQRNRTADEPYYSSILPEYQKSSKIAEPTQDETITYSLTANYDAGPATITSVTSYYDRAVNILQDYSDTDVGAFAGIFSEAPFNDPSLAVPFRDNLSQNIVDSTIKRFAQELRLSSNGDGRLKWIVGGYFARNKANRFQEVVNHDFNDTSMDVFGPGGITLPNDRVFIGNTGRTVREYALFGDLTYDITDAFSLSAGVRWFQNKSKLDRAAGGLFGGGGPLTPRATLLAKEDGFNPKFTANYNITDDSLVYATLSRGFRSGGPNSPIPSNACTDAALSALGLSSAPESFGSDKVWNYEAGSKNAFANGRVIVNGALFYIDWSGIPQSVPLANCGYAFTDNVGKAVSKGGELEIQAEVIEGLRLAFNLGYTEAKLKADAPTLGGSIGDRVQFVPRWVYSLSGDYIFPINSEMNGSIRIDYQYRSSVRRNFIENSYNFKQEGYGVANLRVGVQTEKWDLSVYAQNLFDRNPIINNEGWLPDVRDASDTAIWQAYNHYTTLRPRTIGVNAKYNF